MKGFCTVGSRNSLKHKNMSTTTTVTVLEQVGTASALNESILLCNKIKNVTNVLI